MEKVKEARVMGSLDFPWRSSRDVEGGIAVPTVLYIREFYLFNAKKRGIEFGMER